MATITPQDFRAVFAPSELATFDPKIVARLALPAADASWLTEVGLPGDAAPFLTFGGTDEKTLPTVDDYYQLKGAAPQQFRVMGTTGEGDPIVIDAGTGAVAYLIHDQRFQAVPMNSSVRQLATCLSAYAEMGAATRQANGNMAFLNNDIPAPLIEAFALSLRTVDVEAAKPNTMWATEIDRLRGGRHAE